MKSNKPIRSDQTTRLSSSLGEDEQANFSNAYPYITLQCQLSCTHCYLGNERLASRMSMTMEAACSTLQVLRKLGGNKICFLGGEPTLHPFFKELVGYAQGLGFEKIALDTNGLHQSCEILSSLDVSDLTFIQVSLDGGSEESNDQIRGSGSFDQTIKTIESLCKNGFDVRIICTVNKTNVNDCLNIIELAHETNVTLVKFHIFSGIGEGKNFSSQVLDPYEWMTFTESLQQFKYDGGPVIQYQAAYADSQTIKDHVTAGYDGCIGRNFDRVSVFPDGSVYICSYLFDTDLNFATFLDGEIQMKNIYNEVDLFLYRDSTCSDCENGTVCCGGCPAENLISGGMPCKKYDGIFPVCRLWKATV